MTPTPAPAAPAATLAWRLLRDPPRSGAENMALDHALAEELVEGEAVLRLYAWARPTVSLGRNEPARGLYSRRRAEELGVDFVRRPTGGRAVLHHQELTYAVIAPARALGGVRAAYRSVNEALADALGSLGAPVALAEDGAVPAVDAGPCFGSPAGGEVTAAGRKLVGSAQCRVGTVLLQHGSILLEGDQATLARLSENSGEGPPPPATLTELVQDVSYDDVAEALTAAMPAAFPGSWRPGRYRKKELEAARRLEHDRYGTDAWTWRR